MSITIVYFIADLHFGHKNIIKNCERPFADVAVMDEALIDNWNARVTSEDTVYILGDLMFCEKCHPSVYLERLNGKKHLIIGNHDNSWMKKAELDRFFESRSYMTVIRHEENRITLCHYPMMAFDGDFLIYGHIHNNKRNAYWPLLKTMENALNAGVEVNGHRPITFDELQTNNAVFRKT